MHNVDQICKIDPLPILSSNPDILPQKKKNGKENRPTNDETVVLYEYACVYSQDFIISI